MCTSVCVCVGGDRYINIVLINAFSMLLDILNNSSRTTKSNLLLHLQLSYYKVNNRTFLVLFFY